MAMDMSYKGKTVDDYLRDVKPEHRKMLLKIRKTIKELAPKAVESISYGMPAYKLNGKPLIYFGAFKDHCSLFGGGMLVENMGDKLKGFKTSKGTIQFTVENPLPDSLIKKIVKFRVAENKTK